MSSKRLAKKIKDHQRNKLVDILPLDTPLAIHVFTNNTCNLKCEFCLHSSPNIKNIIYKKQMSLETYKNIIDQISQFPKKIKSLIFAPLGEPLIHKDIAKMVRYAKEKNVSERVDIVTNATLLNKNIADELVDAKLDWLRISLYGLNNAEYQRHTNIKMKDGYNGGGGGIYEKMLENITYLYQHKNITKISIKVMDYMVKEKDKKEQFYKTFAPISDFTGIENCVQISDSKKKDFNKSSIFTDEHNDVKICNQPHRNMYIMENGDVYPCCATEYTLSKQIKSLGNIHNETLIQIWNNKISNMLRYQMLFGKESLGYPCKNCVIPTSFTHPEDNLDNYSEKLKPYYKENL